MNKILLSLFSFAVLAFGHGCDSEPVTYPCWACVSRTSDCYEVQGRCCCDYGGILSCSYDPYCPTEDKFHLTRCETPDGKTCPGLSGASCISRPPPDPYTGKPVSEDVCL